MYKIGIIGERDAVQGFMAIGFAVREAADSESAARQVQAMVKSGKFAVIYLTEQYAMLLEEQLTPYRDLPLPAIVSIPAPSGSTGYGMNHIRSAVERAVGADILFRDS